MNKLKQIIRDLKCKLIGHHFFCFVTDTNQEKRDVFYSNVGWDNDFCYGCGRQMKDLNKNRMDYLYFCSNHKNSQSVGLTNEQ